MCVGSPKNSPTIPGNKTKIQASGLGQTRNALGETSRNVTSHPKDHQPRLSQLPLLFQEHREVVHGGERLWVLRTEVHFAPRKTSALQCLGLASWDGAGGVGPQAWTRLRVPCGEGRKVNNGLVFGLMKKMSNTVVTM